MRTLATVSPLEDFRAVEAMFDRLLGGVSRPTQTGMALPVDISETPEALIVRAAVPGVAPEELELQIENQVLTIKGTLPGEFAGDEKVYRREVPSGEFRRSLRIPETFQAGEATAQFRHGMVTIRIPKTPEVVPPTIRIPIETL